MKRLAIYNETTGEILRIVRCDEAIAAMQCRDGQAWIEAAETVTDLTHRVENGQLVPI